MIRDHVVLVDSTDKELGIMEKMQAHQQGVLHRAFSVFIMNDNKELLLQKRASSKYHSPGLWTNTCCSHPQQGEAVLDAGQERLHQEMGFTVPLTALFSFIYQAQFDNNLIEHELDHVLLGNYNEAPVINSSEVDDYKWMGLPELHTDIKANPQMYTVWFKIVFEQFLQSYTNIVA